MDFTLGSCETLKYCFCFSGWNHCSSSKLLNLLCIKWLSSRSHSGFICSHYDPTVKNETVSLITFTKLTHCLNPCLLTPKPAKTRGTPPVNNTTKLWHSVTNGQKDPSYMSHLGLWSWQLHCPPLLTFWRIKRSINLLCVLVLMRVCVNIACVLGWLFGTDVQSCGLLK